MFLWGYLLRGIFCLKWRRMVSSEQKPTIATLLHTKSIFRAHSSQLHRWCSRVVMFSTWCQENKPANPLGFEVVCAFPTKFHRGLLCCLAQALHPAESKCSQLKASWRQWLCCGKLEKAGKGKGWKAKVLWYCQKWSTSQSKHPSAPATSAHYPRCPETPSKFY